MTAMFELIAAGIAVAIFNKYIRNGLDHFVLCCTQCCDEEEDDCVSSSSTSVVGDACHVHQLTDQISFECEAVLKTTPKP